MPHPLSRIHTADEYGNVVATFGPLYRAIVEPNGLAWAVQRRRSSTGRWFTVSGVLIHRAYVARAALNHMQGRYSDENGITAETVATALEHLPEVYERVPLDKLLVNSPPIPLRVSASPSYKTENDIR